MAHENEIYLEFQDVKDSTWILAPIETVICLFVIEYCQITKPVSYVAKKSESKVRRYWVEVADSKRITFADDLSLPYCVRSCEFPSVVVNKKTIVAGLCATLRQIIKNKISSDEEHYCRSLLGFKDSCLLSTSESSVWTKYCEVDLIAMLRSLDDDALLPQELPITLARFETHMNEPVRLHNAYKYTMSKKHLINGFATNKQGFLLDHVYAEGPFLTLADLIIFVCIYIFFKYMHPAERKTLLPLTSKWYDKIIADFKVVRCIAGINLKDSWKSERGHILPLMEMESLYKSDPKRYKPRNRIFTRQEDIEKSLGIIDESEIIAELDDEPYGADMIVDWSKIPYEARPEGGGLPLQRLNRKCEQLENLCRPVLKLAKPKDIIVDFCSGSGHLGILVAYLLPDCVVILLENKEESLNRSKKRVEKLKLTNVQFFQCNLDYFTGRFDIGMSLHACGVATDLVIQHCIEREAVFVCCPCCYGSIHDCHHISYPRSEIFRNIVDKKDYLVLGHAADQTHQEGLPKTAQGNECMLMIDTDRKLQAEENGYTVQLAKIVPETCTPKNHLIVGIPENRL